MTSLRRTFTIAGVLLGTSGAAHAATTLFTPILSLATGQEVQCVISNVGTKPATLTATVLSGAGTDITNVNNCPTGSTIAPGASCNAFTSSFGGFAYCKFTADSSKVRASIVIEASATSPISRF